MVDPIQASGLISALPSGSGRRAAPSAFGPAAIIDFSAQLTAALTAPPPPELFTERQAEQLNTAIADSVTALNEGRFDDAREHAQSLLRRNYNDPVGYHLLGRIAAARDDFDTAATYYDRAAELSPDSARFSTDAANVRTLRRGIDRTLEAAGAQVRHRDQALGAIRLLFEAGQRTDRQGEIFLLVARGFETLNLPVQQLETYANVVDEGTPEDLQQVEAELQRFIAKNPPVGLAHSLLGRTQQLLGKYNEAVESLERAREIAPETQRYTAELANVHASIGNGALARGDFSSAKYRFNLAHELDLANRDISLGLAAVHVSLARHRLRTGRDNDARIELGRARTLLRDDTSLDREMAIAYQQLGRQALADGATGLALSDLERAYDRAPDLPGLARTLADTRRAEAQRIIDEDEDGDLNTRDHENIVKHLRGAFELFPQRASFRADLASALNDFGLKLMNENSDYERALEVFTEARDLEPGNTAYQANWQQAWHLDNTPT